MDKATAIVAQALAENRHQFFRELARQFQESKADGSASPSLAGRQAARAKAHNLYQLSYFTTAEQMTQNMGAMLLSLNIAARVIGLPSKVQQEAAEDWQASLAA